MALVAIEIEELDDSLIKLWELINARVRKGSRCPGERSESGNAYQRQTNLEPPCGEAAKIGYRPRKAIEEAHWADDSDYI